MKRFFISAIALMMAAAMVTVCAFAAPQKGNREGMPDRNGDRPGNFQKADGKNDRPDAPNSMPMPQRPANNGGFGFDDLGDLIEKKLESLTDDAVKAKLEGLLEAYNTAAEAVQTAIDNKSDEDAVKALREDSETARKALSDALKEAGIEIGEPRPDSNGKKDKALDDFGDLIEKKLESLTDDAVKAKLEDLLEAYNTAAEAVQTAIDNKSDEDAVKALREDSETARKALSDALKEAGIEIGNKAPAPDKNKSPDEKPDKIELSENTPTPEVNAEKSGGLFSMIASWFGKLFK